MASRLKSQGSDHTDLSRQASKARVDAFAEVFREAAMRPDGSLDVQAVVDMAETHWDREQWSRLCAALLVLRDEKTRITSQCESNNLPVDREIYHVERRLEEVDE